MRAFPDGEVLLAALAGEGLSPPHRAALAAAEAIVVSAAVLWQIESWRAAGSVEIRGDLAETLRRAGCRMLAVTGEHVAAAGGLTRGQGGGHDRSGRREAGQRGSRVMPAGAPLATLPMIAPLLVAQARAEGLVILSSDRVYRLYDVEWL